MNIVTTRRGLIAIVGAGLAAGSVPALARPGEQQALVDAATVTFNMLMTDPDMDWLRRNIRRAKGVIIAPSVVKAGFIFGGSGGNAVLLVRRRGVLTGPAFYKLGTASIGFQVGVSASQVLTLVMSDKAIKSVLDGNFKVGGDASAAAGPVGAGAKSDADADFVTFARSKGLYGGLNFEGTAIDDHQKWNAAYYGAGATAADILIDRKPRTNPGAAGLRAAVARYLR